MSASQFNLISLLRLLDDDLPAGVAIRLREQLAVDHELATRFRLLEEARNSTVSAEGLLEELGDVDPLDVAEFVEGGMSPDRQAKFELACWSSDGLLREVVATWEAFREPSVRDRDPDSLDRSRSIVSNLLSPASAATLPHDAMDQEPTADSALIEDTLSSGVASVPAAPIVRVVKSEFSGSHNGRKNGVSVSVGPRPRKSHRRSRQGYEIWIVAAGVIIALLALTVQFLVNPGENRTARPGPEDRSPEQPREPKPHMVQDDPRNESTPNSVQQDSPERSPESTPDADNLVDESSRPNNGSSPRRPRGAELPRRDRMVRDRSPDMAPRPPRPQGPTVPKSNDPLAPLRNNPEVALLAWLEVEGIAGDRRVNSNVWSGIHSRSPAELWHSGVNSQLMTLPQSRVSGTLAGGSKIIADADSLIEVAAAEIASTAGNQATPNSLTPRFVVQRGRVAIDGIRSGQRIQVQVADQRLDIEAKSDDSAFSIERVSGATVLAAYHGRLQMGDRELTRRSWGRVDSAGELTVFQPNRPTDWFRAPTADSGYSSELCDAFNAAPNLLQLAAKFETSAEPGAGKLAATVALSCLAVDGRPIAVGLVRRLVNSNRATHRQALIDWLLARYEDDEATAEADLRIVCRLTQTSPRLTTAMSGWFQSAVAGQAPTNAQLTELISSLRDTSPVFTRQSAKYFLQHILNDPLAEYDPAAATSRAAVSSVTRKVRAWQVANQ